METMPIRKLPVGIQDFTKLREENFCMLIKRLWSIEWLFPEILYS